MQTRSTRLLPLAALLVGACGTANPGHRSTAAGSQQGAASRPIDPPGTGAAGFAESAATATWILVRHAEKLAEGRDPGLSSAGQARAHCLARLLSVAGVTHIYASELERTRATVAPLARQLGLGISVVSATEPERQVELLRALDDHAVALVAGHSNTLPILAKGLGAELDRLDSRGYLPDNAYDRVFVLVPHESGRVELLELRACEPSSQ